MEPFDTSSRRNHTAKTITQSLRTALTARKLKETSVFSSVLLPSRPWLKTLSQSTSPNGRHFSGIILRMRPANDRRRYIVTLSLIGRAHRQNDHRILPTDRAVQGTVSSLWKIAKNSHRWIMTIADVINKLRPVWCRAIIWTNNVLVFLLNWTLGNKFESKQYDFHTKRSINLKMSSAKWQPFCISLNVLTLNFNMEWWQWCNCPRVTIKSKGYQMQGILMGTVNWLRNYKSLQIITIHYSY